MIAKLEDLKQALNIDNTLSDDLLFETLKRAEDEAKLYCNRSFEVASFTEYHNGDCDNKLFLKQYPVVSVTTIHDDIDREYTADDLIDADEYSFDENTGVVTLDYFDFMKGNKNIKVVYRAGYGNGTGETKMPQALVNAIIDLAVADFMESQGTISSVTGTPYEYSGKRKSAYAVLDLFRKIDHK